MTFPRPGRRTCPQPLPTSSPSPPSCPKRGGAGGEPVPLGGRLVPPVLLRSQAQVVRRWQGRSQALTWRGGAEGFGSSIFKLPSCGFQTLPKLHTVGTLSSP